MMIGLVLVVELSVNEWRGGGKPRG